MICMDFLRRKMELSTEIFRKKLLFSVKNEEYLRRKMAYTVDSPYKQKKNNGAFNENSFISVNLQKK